MLLVPDALLSSDIAFTAVGDSLRCKPRRRAIKSATRHVNPGQGNDDSLRGHLAGAHGTKGNLGLPLETISAYVSPAKMIVYSTLQASAIEIDHQTPVIDRTNTISQIHHHHHLHHHIISGEPPRAREKRHAIGPCHNHKRYALPGTLIRQSYNGRRRQLSGGVPSTLG
jgi:hypothetical protein